MVPARRTTPPAPLAVTWARRLQLLGAVLLLIAPFLPWARAPIFRFVLPVPGIFLPAVLLLPASFLVLLGLAVGMRIPLLPLALSGASAFVTLKTMWLVAHRTGYHLKGLQLWLSDLNQALGRLGLPPVEVAGPSLPPDQYLGSGGYVAVIATCVLAAGAIVETLGHCRTRTFLSALAGLPRCRACGERLGDDMRFCPGCGQAQQEGRQCPSCDAWMQGEARFCSWCGAAPGASDDSHDRDREE